METNKTLLNQPEILAQRLREIPISPGVYLMRDRTNDILYIGKSKKLRSRVRSYFRQAGQLSDRIAMMVRQVVEIEFIATDTEAEALALEANLIKQHQPYYNVLLKDDKKYPYVCITWSEEYPRIFITRKRRKLGTAKDRYYGPYVDTRLLRFTLQLVKNIFPLRQRRKPLFKDRPCLNYDIGRCPGVCQTLVTPEEYHKTMEKVAMVFQGRTNELLELLQSQMLQASEALEFELAAKIRDRLQALHSLNAHQKVALPDDTISRDAIALQQDKQHCCIQLFQIRAGKLVGRLGFFTRGKLGAEARILQQVLEEHYAEVDPVEIPTEILVQHPLVETKVLEDWLSQKKGRKVNLVVPQRQSKAELIEMVERNAQYELERTQRLAARNLAAMSDLANLLDLPELPTRIEGYDISHIQGSNAVASGVVFIEGVAAKQHYRHYKIKNPKVKIGHSDDFASMQEVIKRRLHHLDKGDLSKNLSFPDLILIDGGKGQLSAVVKVLEEMNLLSQIKVISLAKQREEIFLPGEPLPLKTNPEQPGVQLLRRVRDEAHRFAISFHRQQRLKNSRRSRLDEIPGLGFNRQKQLLAHFHSIDYIREAKLEQLQAVPGIGSRLAHQIYDYFHPSSL
ncbi:MAG: excinuclease ABC subunit UvrC [Cyanobacteria bacterium J083]|nr:MAG: excinuclease ABC subunit UvrC [Cyanobacteria bacterium J083]